jgi:hypothetical protein
VKLVLVAFCLAGLLPVWKVASGSVNIKPFNQATPEILGIADVMNLDTIREVWRHSTPIMGGTEDDRHAWNKRNRFIRRPFITDSLEREGILVSAA